MGVVAIILGLMRVGGFVGDGDFQNHQLVVWQWKHLHAILISSKEIKEKIKIMTTIKYK